MSELKPLPCPICGAESRSHHDSGNEVWPQRWQVKCSKCWMVGPKEFGSSSWSVVKKEDRVAEAKAIAAWNRRAQPVAQAERTKLPALTFAVFDEFGDGADDRVQDYGNQCFKAGAAQPPAEPAKLLEKLDEAMSPEGIERTWNSPMTGFQGSARTATDAEPVAPELPAGSTAQQWQDAKLRGIASDYFPEAKDWPAAMNCMRHLLMEQQRSAQPPRPEPLDAEPVAWMWQHDETGRTGFVAADFDRAHWEQHNPRLHIVAPCFRRPPRPEPLTDDVWLLLDTALDSLKYHQEQTRPIELTQVTIAAIEAAILAKGTP